MSLDTMDPLDLFYRRGWKNGGAVRPNNSGEAAGHFLSAIPRQLEEQFQAELN
jgi:hypothetical protein